MKNTKKEEIRPWGKYKVLENFEINSKYDFKDEFEEKEVVIKKITVNPLGVLSLQSHKQRIEHWVVVQGTGVVDLGAQAFSVQPGYIITISPNQKHRISNLDNTNHLVFIEVSRGNFDEEDITRYDDIYDRADKK